MADMESLEATRRSVLGKKVKRLRSQGMIPGIVYGKGLEPIPIQLDYKKFKQIYKKVRGTSPINLVITGEGKPVGTLIQKVQRDTLTNKILHADFLKVDFTKPVTVEVPVVLTGKAPVEESGIGKVMQEMMYIHVKALPTQIPHEIEVDISGLEKTNQTIHASDIQLPEGVKLSTMTDETSVIASVIKHIYEEEAEAEEEEEEAEEGEEEKTTEE